MGCRAILACAVLFLGTACAAFDHSNIQLQGLNPDGSSNVAPGKSGVIYAGFYSGSVKSTHNECKGPALGDSLAINVLQNADALNVQFADGSTAAGSLSMEKATILRKLSSSASSSPPSTRPTNAMPCPAGTPASTKDDLSSSDAALCATPGATPNPTKDIPPTTVIEAPEQVPVVTVPATPSKPSTSIMQLYLLTFSDKDATGTVQVFEGATEGQLTNPCASYDLTLKKGTMPDNWGAGTLPMVTPSTPPAKGDGADQ